MMAAIVSGDVPVQATHMPMSSSALQVILNNIQKSLKLVVGQSGGWSVIANEQFFKILAKPKRVRRETPAIMDAQPAAVVNPLEIDVDTEPKENKNHETDSPKEENQNQETNNPGEHAKRADDSDADSSSSSTSSNNSIKSEDMKKILKDTEPETYTWTAEWSDAWNNMLCTLADGYSNPKRRRIAYRVLKTLKEAKAEWDHNNHNRILFFRNVLLSRHLLFSPLASTLFVASSRELMANLLESTMELVGGREWSFEALAVLQMGHVPSTEIENPITMENFLSSACRRCDGIQTATLMFDFHPKVPEFGRFARLGELIHQGKIQDLHVPLSLNGNLPAHAKLGIIVHNLEDSTVNVLKILHFADKFAASSGLELCTGNAYIPVFRQGPWALRKAIQHLLERLPGYRLLWNHVVQKQQSIQRNSSSQWTPDVEALKAGIDYINARLKLTNRWVAGDGGTQYVIGFVYDFLVKFILPLFMTHGLRSWKDSVRHHDGPRLRQRVPRVQEAIFLDDPQRDRVSASDLKGFITVDEERSCSGRYSDVRLTRNGVRVYASNDFEPNDEPKAEGGATMVLKRSIVFVFGKHALYLRMPSENPEVPIHRITVEDVHLDLLSEKDKPYYNKYKQGKIERSPDYDGEVARELELMDNAVAERNGFAKVGTFIKHWSEKIQDELFRRQRRAWMSTPYIRNGTKAPRVDRLKWKRSVQYLCSLTETDAIEVWVGGRWVWEQPTYVKMMKVILPNQKRLTVKVGSTVLISEVRSAQFEYWHRGRDMWQRTGELLSWRMSQIMTK
ncbi:unnamed protein product [Symbiodinium necroappetens]|uniref:Uncharacterized protein n=1 Tax=Symbiodinium necroappetens TaxID=1628268 RepID=A0A812X005_9DINO|nr:unnamed protein product [Symbiodinium necroappetens]